MKSYQISYMAIQHVLANRCNFHTSPRTTVTLINRMAESTAAEIPPAETKAHEPLAGEAEPQNALTKAFTDAEWTALKAFRVCRPLFRSAKSGLNVNVDLGDTSKCY